MNTPSFYPQKEQLQGVIERLTFHAEETGYTVARLKVPKVEDLVTVVGSFSNIQAGQTLQLEGFWRSHPKYGDQFQVTNYEELKPATLTGIEKYLGSGLIKGVGPVTARRIVQHFGEETLEIIENEPDRLLEVPGIAKKRVKMIQAAWEVQRSIKEVMVFLQGHGVSTTYAVKIYKHYGNTSISIVSENPYRLALDIYGIGFITADTIARSVGIEPGSPFRTQAGIFHALGEASEEGHCYLPLTELIDRSVKLLSLKDFQPEATGIEAICHDLALTEGLVVQGDYQGEFICYKPSYYHTEKHLAERIALFSQRSHPVDTDRVRNWIDRFIDKTGILLSPKQQEAVLLAAGTPFMILTGGPGTGKTLTTKAITTLWRAMGKKIGLASPTGRAAQRLQEVTGLEAKTLHRLLEFDPKQMDFQRNGQNPLEFDAVVVDEASMLDMFLASALFKAIPLSTQIVFVGDIDQLPSVGPGQILRDIIASQLVPVVALTEVFRQAQTSQIVQNAHRINQGKMPIFTILNTTEIQSKEFSDCVYWEVDTPENGVETITEIVQNWLPQAGFSPSQAMQVLCPMTRSEVGARNLNRILQEVLNPPSGSKDEVKQGATILRIGDRVMQQVNDYDREVFNGDVGTISHIDREEQELTVTYGNRSVSYDIADWDEISLAWAITIHKSQGSEYPVVLIPLFMQHFMMLNRNLLYTALTRAKKLAIVVGQKRAIAMAVKEVKDRERYTYLSRRVQSAAQSGHVSV